MHLVTQVGDSQPPFSGADCQWGLLRPRSYPRTESDQGPPAKHPQDTPTHRGGERLTLTAPGLGVPAYRSTEAPPPQGSPLVYQFTDLRLLVRPTDAYGWRAWLAQVVHT